MEGYYLLIIGSIKTEVSVQTCHCFSVLGNSLHVMLRHWLMKRSR
uniref:Uncharacterized protein n=1 Tax=Anguilla anguilla TaxID=7936 RepID=A0A0E9W9Y3_ANGAN